jgi:protocatechuate 3,4-dioxygenase beta subunit
VIALLLLALGQQAPPRDARPATATPTGSIAGVVTTDEARPKPLRRVRVALNGPALDVPRMAITADNGAFVFDRVPAGRYTVSASKEGYVSMAHGATRPARPGAGLQIADRQRVQVTMRLPRGAVITGTVVDIDGQPAAGVAVSALARRFTGASPSGDYTYVASGASGIATSDDRGGYRIYGLAAGDYLVAAQPAPRPVGAPGTTVRTMSRGTMSERSVQMSQTFHPGTSELGQASRVPVRTGEERAGIDIQLEYVPLAIVSGLAVVPAGFAPARLTLWRTDELARFQTGPVATADNQGRFRFTDVPPGQYRVTARASPVSAPAGGRGGAPSSDVHYAIADVVVNGQDVEVSLTAQPGLSIAGRFVFESARGATPQLPTQRLSLPIMAASGAWPMPPLVIDGMRFRVDGIAPGRYRLLTIVQGIRAPIGSWWLTSIAAGGRELLDAPLDIQQSLDDAVATFTDTPSVLSGAVADTAGQAAPELFVVAFSVDRRSWFTGSRRVAAIRPTREGRYTISNLPPGEYRITVADLDQNEWFDPAVLERLMTTARPVTIAGAERQTVDLVAK